MMYGSWDIRYDKKSFWMIFCPLTLLTTWKIKLLKKRKKSLKILSFYTCIPQMMIIWCMIPEIWSTRGRIFCHFGLFFALLPSNNPANHNFEKMKNMPVDIIILHMFICDKWKSYDKWFLRYGAWQTIFSHFGPFFALLPP